ncbi:MAG TPA: hypothetical protein VK158_04480 [Acidobacteriota bacterium]|nr:hypothetical protein [Acidobacteriota bacterium]
MSYRIHLVEVFFRGNWFKYIYSFQYIEHNLLGLVAVCNTISCGVNVIAFSFHWPVFHFGFCRRLIRLRRISDMIFLVLFFEKGLLKRFIFSFGTTIFCQGFLIESATDCGFYFLF